jgi:hypothetical protein
MLVRPPDTPFENNYQRQANEAYERATEMSAAELRKIRPPLPQIRYLPPRFGYPSYADRQWTLLQVFGITRLPSGGVPGFPHKPDQRVDYSGYQGEIEGSPRNTNSNLLGNGGLNW